MIGFQHVYLIYTMGYNLRYTNCLRILFFYLLFGKSSETVRTKSRLKKIWCSDSYFLRENYIPLSFWSISLSCVTTRPSKLTLCFTLFSLELAISKDSWLSLFENGMQKVRNRFWVCLLLLACHCYKALSVE